MSRVNRGFRPDIEGLRAVAILLVLVYHAGFDVLSGGFIGVDVFFVISGFLITGSLLEEVEREGCVSLAQFYTRRIRRLLPAAALVLTATAIGIFLLLPNTSWRAFGGDVIAAATYWVNWRFAARSVDYLAEDVDASPVQHFWSLAVEEQFYLVWPIIIGAVGAIASRRKDPRSSIGVALLAIVTLPSFALSIVYTEADSARAFFVTTTRMWELGIGGLAAVVSSHLRLGENRVSGTLKLGALAAIVVTAFSVDGSALWPGWLALIPTVSTAVLLLAGAGDRDLVERVLTLRPMQAVGRLSYSLYLWHWPFIAILASKYDGLTTAQASGIVVASVLPAWLSYRFVENPVRYSPRLRASAARTLALGGHLTMLGVAIGALIVLAVPTTRDRRGGDEFLGAAALSPGITDQEILMMLERTTSFVPAAADAVEDLPVIYDDGCPASERRVEPIVCEYGDPTGSIHVALVGDSKIAQWATPFIDIAEAERWRLSVMTKSSCAFSAVAPLNQGAPYEECREWSARVVRLLQQDPADLVVVSQVGSRAVELPGLNSEESLVEGMLRIYREVEKSGARVVMLVDNPHPGFPVYECVAEHPTELGRCTFSREERLMHGGRPAQLRVAELGGYPTIDMLPGICPTDTCPPVIGEVLIYRQGSHLTDSYVGTMRDQLANELVGLLPNRSVHAVDLDS